jgi:hypothetical protein
MWLYKMYSKPSSNAEIGSSRTALDKSSFDKLHILRLFLPYSAMRFCVIQSDTEYI